MVHPLLLLALALPLANAACYSSLSFTSEGGHITVGNGAQVFRLHGVSWFGYETSNNVFHGLWAQDYHFFLDIIKKLGFNAIRVPFYLELVLSDATPDSINFYQMNTDLHNLTSLQVLDKIVAAAAERGLLIMLDLHSFKAGTFMQDGMWYDSTHPESMVLSGWDTLIARYKDQWNVFAFDLKNEPRDTTWATGNNFTDWNSAVARIGDHIFGRPGGSKFLLFAEGTGHEPPCPQACFWGEDLMGVASNPISFSNSENNKKLVYSPHCYGPAVSAQTYFDDPSFPNNMPAIWDSHWGYVAKQTGNAVVIGEWGGPVTDSNGVWMKAFVSYLKSKDLASTFFWCLNPDSGDTGGLLGYDWKTVDQSKAELLSTLMPSPSKITLSGGQFCVD